MSGDEIKAVGPKGVFTLTEEDHASARQIAESANEQLHSTTGWDGSTPVAVYFWNWAMPNAAVQRKVASLYTESEDAWDSVTFATTFVAPGFMIVFKP